MPVYFCSFFLMVLFSFLQLSILANDLELKLKNHIPFHPHQPNTIGYLSIGDHEESINEATWLYIKKGLDNYKKLRPIFIILELNTPGGELFIAQKISDALKEIDIQEQIPVVAVINNWAISAGAMVAYSCRFIATVKDGSMGAAEPIVMQGGQIQNTSEKITSALRTDFASRAAFFDRNPLIAEAMVDKEMILVQREGKVVSLHQESQLRLSHAPIDRIISAKGKLLTLDAQKMMTYGVADLLLTPRPLPQITAEQKQKGSWNAKQMLLFTAPFFSSIPNATVQAYQMDLTSKFFIFLLHPVVSSLLLMGLIVGAYLELSAPGLSFPGFIASFSLFLIFLSHFSLEGGGLIEIILLILGFSLILIEFFLFPTGMVFFSIGLVFFIIAIFSLLLPAFHLSDVYDQGLLPNVAPLLLKRVSWLLAALLLSFLFIIFFSRYLLKNRTVLHRFVLQGEEQEASKGFRANPSSSFAAGQEATAFTDLKPSGKVQIEGKLYEAISDSSFIAAGQKVKVLRREAGTFIVTAITGEF